MRILKHPFSRKYFIILATLCACILLYQLSLKKPYLKEFSRYQTLSQTTQSLLSKFEAPLHITLYTKDIDIQHHVKLLITRYQLKQPNIVYEWKRTIHDTAPYPPHSVVLRYRDQTQKIPLSYGQLTEKELTSSLFKMHRKANQWVVFLQGHSEPSPFGQEARDFNLLRLALEAQGLKSQRLNLTKTPFIPENTQLLVVASLKSALMPIEERLLLNYLASGKDLLWLIDSDSAPIESLSKTLGVFPAKGTIIDLKSQRMGTPHPAMTLVSHYPSLPFSTPDTSTAFPWSTALINKHNAEFQSTPLLLTSDLSWTETDEIKGTIRYNADKEELMGPLTLGLNLTRQLGDHKEQRITIIGNSRFLSNSVFEKYGNRALGLNLFNWLCHDDALIQIHHDANNDTLDKLHWQTAHMIEYVYPLAPWLLLALGSFWFYHRSQTSNRIAIRLSKA